MLCAPGLTADTSSVPESMSSISDWAVSKLLFMVVAITPVGPVFTQPLQYRPGETRLSKLNVVSLIVFFFTQRKMFSLGPIFLKLCSLYLQLAERGPFCWGRRPCGCRMALRDRLRRSCSRCCWWSGHRPHPPPHQWALRAHPHLSPGHTQVTYSLMNCAIPWLTDRQTDRRTDSFGRLKLSMEVYLQPVDSQSNASCPRALRVGQDFNRAPVESEGTRAGGLPSPLLLLLVRGFQGRLHQQLCQTLPGPWDIWQSKETKASNEMSTSGSFEKAKYFSTQKAVCCLSCATPQANDWFSEKPTVHSRSNQQRVACHQSRNWCATEQLLPATHSTHAIHSLDSPLTVPVNNATQATGWSFSIWSSSQWLGPWGEPRQRGSSLVTDHSDINKAFSCIQLPLNGYFLSLRRFSVEPGDGCPPKSHKYFPFLMLKLNFSKAPSQQPHA